MITGNTRYIEEAKQFDDWISKNYETLRKYCKKYHYEEDILNTVYLNVKNRILLYGYDTNQYLTYMKHSITNLRINEAKKCKGKHWIDFDDCNYQNTVENKLTEIDTDEKSTMQYREDVLYFSKMLFKYIENVQKYDEESLFVFRTYYLMPNRFTYSKLTAMTGLNKNRCTKIIQTMKQDIRDNLLIWIKTQQNNEIQD